jgi:hypothetical protein
MIFDDTLTVEASLGCPSLQAVRPSQSSTLPFS